MIGLITFLFGVFVTLAMSVWAAQSDFKGFKIPNSVSLVILGSFFVVYGILYLLGVQATVFKPIGSHIGAAFIVFMVTLTMFALKQLGAGDSKFATSIALWVGFGGLVPFLFYMALAGGVIGAFSLYMRKKKPFQSPPEGSWIDQAQKGAGSVPYGIAIAVGAFVSFIFAGYLSPTVWASMF